MDAGNSLAVTPYQSTTRIDDLPDEVLIEIFFYLTKPKQLVTIRAVSSRWRNLASTKWLWNEVDLDLVVDIKKSEEFATLSCLKIAPCLRSLTAPCFQSSRYFKCDSLETLVENCSSIRRLKFDIDENDAVLLKILHKYKSVIEHLNLSYVKKHATKLMEILPFMPRLMECVLEEYGYSSPDLPLWELWQHAGINDWPSLQKFSYNFCGHDEFQILLIDFLQSLGSMRLKLKELEVQSLSTHLVRFELDKSLDLCRHMDVLSISAYCLDLKWDMRDKSWIKLNIRDTGSAGCESGDWTASRCLLSVKEILMDHDCCPCTTSLLKGCRNVEKVVAIIPLDEFRYHFYRSRPYVEPLQGLSKIIEVLPNLKSIVVKAYPELVKLLIESTELSEMAGQIEVSFDTLEEG